MIEVPHRLQHYWQWKQPAAGWRSYRFYNLTKVQTLRFVQLCEQYGSKEGTKRIVPLAQWQADDRADLQEMLEIVGSK